MQKFPSSTEMVGKVVVHLLDPASGRPVKSWEFAGHHRITIGRSPDQDIAMSDPYVSRAHAEFLHRDGHWHLISLGRNGVVIANQLVTEHEVTGDVHFRLGVEGPMLKFSEKSEHVELMATIRFEVEPEPLFQLDEQKLQQEVAEIEEGEFFQSLQRRARELRLRRIGDTEIRSE